MNKRERKKRYKQQFAAKIMLDNACAKAKPILDKIAERSVDIVRKMMREPTFATVWLDKLEQIKRTGEDDGKEKQ